MTLYELHEIIEGGESSTVEFKRKFTEPEKIAKEMIAFANTKGGRLLFGIDDDKSVVGVESEKGEIEYIDLAAGFRSY
jgi:predicted HTH transcriptional regulator